jgi:hypothetical protein
MEAGAARSRRFRFEGSDLVLGRGVHMSIPRATYGTILLLALIVPLERRVPTVDANEAAAVVFGAATVFWAAHVYSEILGTRIAEGSLSRRRLGSIMAGESALILVAIPPLLLVISAGIGVMGLDTALRTAEWLGVGTLFLWGLVAARAAAMGWPAALVMGVVDAAFGAILVVLELWLTH